MEIASVALNQIKERLVTSYSNGQPNWSYIPSASKSSKSQSEFTSEIKELARKAATTTDRNILEVINKQVLSLRAEYLSDVAPDRKSLYQSACNIVNKNLPNAKCKGQGELTLLDFINNTDKKEDLAEKRFILVGGGYLTCPMLTGGGHAAIINYGGTNVLCNIGAGWGYEMTSAELAKKDEFYSVYWNEYRSVKDDSELAELPDYLTEKSIFDKRA